MNIHMYFIGAVDMSVTDFDCYQAKMHSSKNSYEFISYCVFCHPVFILLHLSTKNKGKKMSFGRVKSSGFFPFTHPA